METYIGIGILGVFFTVFAVAIVAGRRHAKAMKKFSGTIGFSYMPHADDDEKFLRQFNRLQLFSRGRNQDVWYRIGSRNLTNTTIYKVQTHAT